MTSGDKSFALFEDPNLEVQDRIGTDHDPDRLKEAVGYSPSVHALLNNVLKMRQGTCSFGCSCDDAKFDTRVAISSSMWEAHLLYSVDRILFSMLVRKSIARWIQRDSTFDFEDWEPALIKA